jgi:hypothetical protein
MSQRDDYVDRNLPSPRFVPPFSSLLLAVCLLTVIGSCGAFCLLISRMPPLGPGD